MGGNVAAGKPVSGGWRQDDIDALRELNAALVARADLATIVLAGRRRHDHRRQVVEASTASERPSSTATSTSACTSSAVVRKLTMHGRRQARPSMDADET